MPDKRKHRGRHPRDEALFAAAAVEKLKSAVDDHSALLSKGYASKAALKLVGDHFGLQARQRLAVERCADAFDAVEARRRKAVAAAECRGRTLAVDGFNLLITVECALSGGLVLVGRDGARRDLASVHGTYRRVTETRTAIRLVAETVRELDVATVRWFLDAPVSNSGRLKSLLTSMAVENEWPWTVELLQNPDEALASSDAVVVSSDRWILDRCRRWLNLQRLVIQTRVPDAWVVSLS